MIKARNIMISSWIVVSSNENKWDYGVWLLQKYVPLVLGSSQWHIFTDTSIKYVKYKNIQN